MIGLSQSGINVIHPIFIKRTHLHQAMQASDITFISDCSIVETLVSLLFRELFSHPYISFFSLTLFLRTPYLPCIGGRYQWAVSVGGEELKLRQLAHHQLMSQPELHFSPHTTDKTSYKSTVLRKNGI